MWRKKIKKQIDDTAVYADWLNNDNLKSKLASQLTCLLYKEEYPPQWDQEVFQKVLEQVENYKKNNVWHRVSAGEKEGAREPFRLCFLYLG